MSDFGGTRARRPRVAGPAGGGFRPLLERGDRVGVVATGFAVRHDVLDAGLARLRRMGFVPVPGEHVGDVEGYLAGDDGRRLLDLNRALRDPSLAAIWFARGGYGTARLLELVDWGALRRRPKVLVGYSDLTALFGAAQRRRLGTCLHGPTVADLATDGAWHARSLRAALSGLPQSVRLTRGGILAGGRARGTLVGGNLAVLAHLVGTPHAPPFDGAVLFLEEIGEEAYRVDRALTQLRQAGVLDRVAAIALGWFDAPPARRAFPGDVPVDEVLRDRLATLGVPVVAGVPSGHRAGKWTLPLGGVATVDTSRRTVVLEPPRGGRRR